MKIEKYLSPNCSELCFAVHTSDSQSDLLDFLDTLKANKIDVSMDGFDATLPSDITALLMKQRDLDNVRKLQLTGMLRKKKVSDEDIAYIIKAIGENEHAYFSVCDKTGSASLILDDGLGTSGCPIFMISDSDADAFPLLYKLESLFNGEIYGHDGGHTDGYEEYKNKKEGKK